MAFTSVEEALQFRWGSSSCSAVLVGLLVILVCLCAEALAASRVPGVGCMTLEYIQLPTLLAGSSPLLSFTRTTSFWPHLRSCSARLRLPNQISKDKAKTQRFVEEVRHARGIVDLSSGRRRLPG